MERVASSAPGRLEVAGRWHGVRGRRFVRPTLTITRGSDGSEVRVLAELDQKPWAADDGEEWVATFATDVAPDDATAMELTVAPDIIVPLGGAVSAPPRRASRRRQLDRTTQELERLRARAASADEVAERERERRQALEATLESERAESRRVRIELGQLRAELELAQAGRAETAESAAELDRVQRELYQARQLLDRRTRERDRAAKAHSEVRTALHEQTGALKSAREALERQRDESSRQPEHVAPGPRVAHSASPSLYHRASTGGRVLAVLFLFAVAIVIVLIIQGTIGR